MNASDFCNPPYFHPGLDPEERGGVCGFIPKKSDSSDACSPSNNKPIGIWPLFAQSSNF